MIMNKIVVISCFAMLTACTSSSQQPVAQKDTGRPETKKLEAATAVGYDGKAIRNTVDKTLNINDERTKDVEKQAAESK